MIYSDAMRDDTQRRLTPALPDARDPRVSPVAGLVYRFEGVEVSSSRGSVTRNGEEHHIRQQSFQVLLHLLHERERLVTKEELIEKFWEHTAVTDNALVQCIADIRKVLGDDSRQPRFIRTIPKVGYRFVAAVEVERPEVPHSAPKEPAQTAAFRPGVIHENPLGRAAAALKNGRIPFYMTLIGLTAILVVSVAVHYSWARSSEVTLQPISGEKPIAVMYFENQSKRTDLNWLREGLTDMFIAGLARSDRLIILGRQQLQLLLERVGHKPPADIRLDEALEVARRSHAEAVMLGSFAALGERLLVNVQLYESAHGRLLVSDQFVVNRTTDVLGQVDLMSLKLTARLGAAPSDRSRNVSLAEVMTNNFEAYRYYSLGLGKAQNFENAEAVTLLRKAIELDPKFAMAYARIGYAYSVTDFLPDQGTPYLERAFRLSDRLTEKDRLYVSAWYAIARRDYLSAIRTLQQLIAQYPLEMEAYARLARLLDREERVEAAISVIQQGLAVDPDAADLYNALGICFLGLHRYQDAIAAHERYVQLSPMEPNAHDSLGMSYQQAGRYADAAAEYKAALALNSKFEPAIIHLGDVYCQEGRYRDGIREYQRYSRVTQSGAARAVAFGSIAQVYRWKGDVRLGEQAARTETSYQPGAVWNSLLFALDRGDKAEASRLRERLFEDSPYPERGVRHELRSYDYYLGAIALKNGQSEEALSYFKEALRHLPPSSGLDLYEDCLANAYLELGRLDDAISEYERILHLNPNYPLAQYHLGQAYERKGQFQQARSAYLAFLNVWPDADSDIPEVIEAKEAAYATSARIR